MATATVNGNIGKITQVIGSTFDAEFDEEHLPAIYNAVKIESNHKGVPIKLTGEVQQQLGGGRVRCVALGSTDGLVRECLCGRRGVTESGELAVIEQSGGRLLPTSLYTRWIGDETTL